MFCFALMPTQKCCNGTLKQATIDSFHTISKHIHKHNEVEKSYLAFL